MQIKDLRNTTEISNIAINCIDLNCIDQTIYESEQEILNGAEAIDADIAFAELEKKYFG